MSTLSLAVAVAAGCGAPTTDTDSGNQPGSDVQSDGNMLPTDTGGPGVDARGDTGTTPTDTGIGTDAATPTDTGIPGQDVVSPSDAVSPTDVVVRMDVVTPVDVATPLDVVSPRDVVTPTDVVSPMDVVRTDVVAPMDVVGTDAVAPRDAASDVVTPTDSGVPTDASVITPSDPGTADVRFTVNSTLRRAAISRYVYGANFADFAGPARNLTLSREGGNRWTAYNWENNASNAGSDYLYQNDNYLCSSAGCSTPGEAMRRPTADAIAHNASMILTVPIAGYVSADTGPGGDVRGSGSGYLSTRFRQLRPRKGSALSLTPDTSDGFVYADEMVNWIDRTFPMARTDPTRTVLYMLDNEPDLWSSTHAEIHPAPVTYAEMVQRSTDYASAIKSVVPSAMVLGFVSYGFNGYVNLQNAPDAAGRDFINFYLDSMRAAETTAGRRLLDALDLHWYPEAQGGGVRITEENTSAAVVAARVQAPRSLWDTTYRETSWIVDYLGQPIRLIPRVRDQINAHYPGTYLSFSEWYYGGGNHISGAVATADALGIFGREGIFAATMWPMTSSQAFTFAGFAMYRNYDGADHTFGDTSIAADNTDATRASVYASVDAASPNRMVLVVINKTNAALSAGIQVTHTTAFHTAQVYQLTSASSTPAHSADVAITGTNAFRYTMPAMSVSTLVLVP